MNKIYRINAKQFEKIPGSRIAYWNSPTVFDIFEKSSPLISFAVPRQGLQTGDNDRFLRQWFETSLNKIGFDGKNGIPTKNKWYPTNKGGSFRRWGGNHEYTVNWENDGYQICNFKDEKGNLRSRPQNMQYFFRLGITWSTISTFKLSMRESPSLFLFNGKGSVCFPLNNNPIEYILGFTNSVVADVLLQTLSPTIDFSEGSIGQLPLITNNVDIVVQLATRLISLSRADWDSYETSWDFQTNPLVAKAKEGSGAALIEDVYKSVRQDWQDATDEMKRLEEENNRIFINAYGLQDELTSEVPLKEITLTCNPYYRYGSDDEDRLRLDTVKELISYAVGCMMGRYSLEKPGLILADQGSTLKDYQAKTAGFGEPYKIDLDGIIPVLDDIWFDDDIELQFNYFLKRAFGEQTFDENVKYIESVLGKRIRQYFQKDFYNDHVKMYKKRPIYWLVTSPSGSFSCLIYLHRYFKDTFNIVLNKYLRLYLTKLENARLTLEQINADSGLNQRTRTANVKQIGNLGKTISELRTFEREQVYMIAQDRPEIDLDDGVKVNYVKFYPVLKKIPGLSTAETD